jgi:hypothetical protein
MPGACEAVRLLAALVQTPQLAALGSETIVLDNGDAVRASELAGLAERDEWTDAFVQRFVAHYAVVDQHGRVRHRPISPWRIWRRHGHPRVIVAVNPPFIGDFDRLMTARIRYCRRNRGSARLHGENGSR